MDIDLQAALPHRPPFLLIDEITALEADTVRARTTLRPSDALWGAVYSGHYPGNPITPGVLLCEMMFQASAVLVHQLAQSENLTGVPVVTRIQGMKFKSMVLPGDTVEISATLTEKMANAFFMKGIVKKDGKTAVQGEFAVALA